jgi:hypothetical protein
VRSSNMPLSRLPPGVDPHPAGGLSDIMQLWPRVRCWFQHDWALHKDEFISTQGERAHLEWAICNRCGAAQLVSANTAEKGC